MCAPAPPLMLVGHDTAFFFFLNWGFKLRSLSRLNQALLFLSPQLLLICIFNFYNDVLQLCCGPDGGRVVGSSIRNQQMISEDDWQVPSPRGWSRGEDGTGRAPWSRGSCWHFLIGRMGQREEDWSGAGLGTNKLSSQIPKLGFDFKGSVYICMVIQAFSSCALRGDI